MAAPELKRTNFSDLYGSTMLPVLKELFRSNLTRHPSVRDLLFRNVPHDRDIWQYSEIHDMPLFSSISEGNDYSFSRQKQGYDKTMTVVKYGLGFSISEEAVDDGKFDFIADALSKMASSARETQEQAAMDILNNGFTSETTADSVALFSTAHTTPSGNITIANTPSTHLDLSFTSLAQLLSNFKKAFRGDSGIYQMVRPKYLVVPTELGYYARQLVQSAQVADNANNGINPFQNELQVIESVHLSDSDAWFLIGDKQDNGLRLINRKGIEMKAGGADVGFLNDSMLFKARYRETLGAVNPIGIYGTRGA